MSLALYRTYRPGRLADVIGQEHVTVPLARAVDSDRLHHAYLLTGPRGCGKTSTARILARAANCEKGPTANPCGECESCIDLAPNGPGHIDVIEIDAATYRGIEDTKELRERAMYSPATSRYKFYIIDEAHQLTRDAFPVLLKLVEEPPPHLRFIFATTEPDRILPTLRSRCHHYNFKLVSARELQDHLANICAKEGIAAESAALALVARAGAGSVRDALSVLGQVAAGAGPNGITYTETLEQLGFTDEQLLSEFVSAIASADGAALFRLVDQVVTAGNEPRRFVMDLLERLRDLLIISQVPDAVDSGLFDRPLEQVSDLAAQAKLFNSGQLVRVADLVNTGLSDLRGAAAPRLQLELLAARLVTPEASLDISERVAKLEQGPPAPSRAQLHEHLTAAVPLPPAANEQKPAPAKPAAVSSNRPAPKRPSAVKGEVATEAAAPAEPQVSAQDSAPSTSSQDLAEVQAKWSALLERLANSGIPGAKTSISVFRDSAPLAITPDGDLTVGLKHGGLIVPANEKGNMARLQLAVQEVLRINSRISFAILPSSVAVEQQDEIGDASPDDRTVGTTDTVELFREVLGATVIAERPSAE